MVRRAGHIRQRAAGTFEVRYTSGTDPLTGRRKTVTITVKGDRKAAEKELRARLHALDTGVHVDPSQLTVGQFLAEWLESMTSRVSPKTHERYSQIVKSVLIPALGHRLLYKLLPAEIQQTYIKWETSGRRDGKAGGLSPRTRLHIHRTFKSALKHAVYMQLLIRNPAEFVKPPRIKKTTITVLTVEQSAVLLEALRGRMIYWPVLIALTTGMRRGEVGALRWKHIDFENKTLRVIESIEQSKKGIRFKAPKTDRTRAIILPAYVVEELRELKEQQEREYTELKIRHNQDTLIFSRYDGTPIWPSSISHEFQKELKKLPELPRVRFHDLRHSHATQLLQAGIHPKIAQERLGHSTITTTLDLYSHVTDTMQDEAAAVIDGAFRSALKSRKRSDFEPK